MGIDWYTFCLNNFKWEIADTNSLKIYVAKGKITSEQYKQITNIDYVAS